MASNETALFDRLTTVGSPGHLKDWETQDSYYVTKCRVF